MSKQSRSDRNLSRRQALKVCLVPAGLAATGWLLACDEGGDLEGGLGGFDAGATGGAPDAALDANALQSSDSSVGSGDASTVQTVDWRKANTQAAGAATPPIRTMVCSARAARPRRRSCSPRPSGLMACCTPGRCFIRSV